MTTQDYKEITLQTAALAGEVGKFIKTEKDKISKEIIETKGLHNFVTYVDKTAEAKLVEGLSKIVPDSGFIAEEGTSKREGKTFRWIVDPLDGTTNFIHGLPPFAISIALQENEKTVVGVIYEIERDECFYAWKDSAAYMNEKEIHVSARKTVNDALIGTGFPYYDYSLMPRFLETLDYFMQNSHGIRRIGSAATDLAYVACGRFEAFYEYSLSPWDVAAGAFIVQRAGGKVCDFSGGNDYIFGKEIIATNDGIFEEFAGVVKKMMKM
jgi:myo-inositol-1(or 4)-monophosphatase